MAHATGVQNLSLGEDFRKQLSEALGVEVPVSSRLFIDYHLDWLVSSLRLAYDQPARLFFKNAGKEVKGNQEDVDLLVAFEVKTVTHLVMIEAKAGSSWSKKQLLSKVEKLENIFVSGEVWSGHVQPHFLLLSPTEPSEETLDLLPQWNLDEESEERWLKLNYPNERLVVERTMADGRPSRTGRHYLVRSEWKKQRRAA